MKIEKHILPPPPVVPAAKRGTFKDTAQQMEIGDSVLCSTVKEATSLKAAIRKRNAICQSEQYQDGTVRVWLTGVIEPTVPAEPSMQETAPPAVEGGE